MSKPLLGHLDPDFLDIMAQIKTYLQQFFQTQNELTFAVSAPGSAGIETCLVNLLEHGDEAIICIHGVFGGRMADIVDRCGAKAIIVESEWGKWIDPQQVKDALANSNPKLVAIVHAETSTGVLQPLQEISEMVHASGALFVVDAVTSFTGTELKVDEWGIDAIYSGTQKCISAPPGLSPVSFGARAIAAIDNRKTKVQSWFLDLTMVKNYWGGAERAYHHTAPISAMYGLLEALSVVAEEGLENRIERHAAAHAYLKENLASIGLEFLVPESYRLPMLNTIKVPEGVNEKMVRSNLLNKHNIEIGVGLGALAAKVWRIGLMGENAQPEKIDRLLNALREEL